MRNPKFLNFAFIFLVSTKHEVRKRCIKGLSHVIMYLNLSGIAKYFSWVILLCGILNVSVNSTKIDYATLCKLSSLAFTVFFGLLGISWFKFVVEPISASKFNCNSSFLKFSFVFVAYRNFAASRSRLPAPIPFI